MSTCSCSALGSEVYCNKGEPGSHLHDIFGFGKTVKFCLSHLPYVSREDASTKSEECISLLHNQADSAMQPLPSDRPSLERLQWGLQKITRVLIRLRNSGAPCGVAAVADEAEIRRTKAKELFLTQRAAAAQPADSYMLVPTEETATAVEAMDAAIVHPVPVSVVALGGLVDPATKPAVAAIEPVVAMELLVDSAVKPAGAATEPVVAMEVLVGPAAEPTVAATEPVVAMELLGDPLAEPAVAATEPVVAMELLADPLAKPAVAATEPVVAIELLVDPAVEPAVAATEPVVAMEVMVDPAVKPTVDATEPVVAMEVLVVLAVEPAVAATKPEMAIQTSTAAAMEPVFGGVERDAAATVTEVDVAPFAPRRRRLLCLVCNVLLFCVPLVL
eukprot:gene12296-15452_t